MHFTRLWAPLLSLTALCMVGCAPPAGRNLPDLKNMRDQPVPPASLAQKQQDIAALETDAHDMWDMQAQAGLSGTPEKSTPTLEAYIHRGDA